MKILTMPGAVLLILALLGVPAARGDDKPAEVSKKVQDKLGPKVPEILAGATRVEVFRIDPDPRKKPDEKGVGGFLVTATGKEQGKEFASRLTRVLLDERTYFSDRQYKCFDPGLAYRVWKDKESVEVLVCFKCHKLRVTARDAEGKEVHEAEGDFQNAVYGPLAKLAKEAFPDDKEIQQLQDPAEKK
jgi:hypothetical protein